MHDSREKINRKDHVRERNPTVLYLFSKNESPKSYFLNVQKGKWRKKNQKLLHADLIQHIRGEK